VHGSSRPICSIFEKEYSVLFISDTVAYGISSTALVTSLELFSTECKLIRLVLLCTVIVVLFFIDCQCLSSAVISTVVYMASRRRISLRPCNWHPTCLYTLSSPVCCPQRQLWSSRRPADQHSTTECFLWLPHSPGTRTLPSSIRVVPPLTTLRRHLKTECLTFLSIVPDLSATIMRFSF